MFTYSDKFCILDLPIFKSFNQDYLTKTPYSDVYDAYVSTISQSHDVQKTSANKSSLHVLEQTLKTNVSRMSSSMLGKVVKLIVVETKGNIDKAKNDAVLSPLKQDIDLNCNYFFTVSDFLSSASVTDVIASDRMNVLFIPTKYWDESSKLVIDSPYKANAVLFPISENKSSSIYELVRNFSDIRSMKSDQWINISMTDILAKVPNFNDDIRYSWLLHLIIPGSKIYKLSSIHLILREKGYVPLSQEPLIVLPVSTKYNIVTLKFDTSHCPVYDNPASNQIYGVVNKRYPKRVTFNLNDIMVYTPIPELRVIVRNAFPLTGLLNEQLMYIMGTVDDVQHRFSLSYYFALACPFNVIAAEPYPDLFFNTDVFLLNIWRPIVRFSNPFILISSPKGSGKSSYSKFYADQGHIICDSDFYGYVLHHLSQKKDKDVLLVPFLQSLFDTFSNSHGGTLESALEQLASKFICDEELNHGIPVRAILVKATSNNLASVNVKASGLLKSLVRKFCPIYNSFCLSLLNYQDYTNIMSVIASQMHLPQGKKFLLFVHNDYETNFALGNTIIQIDPILQPLITISLRAGKRDTSYFTDLFLYYFYLEHENDARLHSYKLGQFLQTLAL